ncbi:MAG: CoA transferase, partial [Rhodothermales bacterium]
INQSIADWTARQDAFELERYLAARAVPASVVQRPLDVHNDAQIEARKLKQLLPHSECGEGIHYGVCTRFSAKPEMLRSAPPCLGENNEEVMRVLLGMGDDEVRAMYESGAVK